MSRNGLDKLHLLEDLSQLPAWEWLRVHVVHSALEGFLDVVFLNVASDCKDGGLVLSFDAIVVPELSHSLS